MLFKRVKRDVPDGWHMHILYLPNGRVHRVPWTTTEAETFAYLSRDPSGLLKRCRGETWGGVNFANAETWRRYLAEERRCRAACDPPFYDPDWVYEPDDRLMCYMPAFYDEWMILKNLKGRGARIVGYDGAVKTIGEATSQQSDAPAAGNRRRGRKRDPYVVAVRNIVKQVKATGLRGKRLATEVIAQMTRATPPLDEREGLLQDDMRLRTTFTNGV